MSRMPLVSDDATAVRDLVPYPGQRGTIFTGFVRGTNHIAHEWWAKGSVTTLCDES